MTSGIRRVILKSPTKEIVVPATTTIAVGVDVIRIPTVHPVSHQYGSQNESIGLVVKLSNIDNNIAAVVEWGNGMVSTESIINLLALIDFKSVENTHDLKPLYNIDQVLYVKPTPSQRAAANYPAIGSKYETDIKVIEVSPSELGSVILYKVYIPSYGYSYFEEHQLCTSKEKERIKHEDFKEYFFDIDSPPFLSRGERVKVYDGYLYNSIESVILKITPELKEHLLWAISPKSEK